MNHPTLGGLDINLPVLLETRGLIQANSGGGKSHALRRLIEQTAPGVQQIIIDPEGEFASLREKFDFIICAPSGGDAVANPSTAAALARAVWESGVSAIVDIYELKAHERVVFVRRFLEALINAPKSIWHPTMVVLDEIQIFAPQTRQCESLGAVVDLATRGRKRGLALIGATQRLANLHKDVAAELLNKLIGRTGLDVDVKRAADELGMSAREAMERLRPLDPGHFFAFGPALSRTIVETRIGAVATTHPQPGQRMAIAPPPASKALLSKLSKLQGIQRDAAEEAKTVEALTAELTKLRAELKKSPVAAAAPGVNETEVKRRIDEAVAAARAQAPDPVVLEMMREALLTSANAARLITAAVDNLKAHTAARDTPHFKHAAAPVARPNPAPAAPSPARTPVVASAGMSGPEQRIVDAIAWLEALGIDEPEQPAVAFLAGYSYGGGAFNNPKGRLNQRGMVEYRPNSCIRLTDAGRAVANQPPAAASNADLHERVLARLTGPEQRLLRPLLDAFPGAMTNADLAAAAGYTAGAGAFNNPRGKLRTLGLVEYPQPGYVAARGLLFPKGV